MKTLCFWVERQEADGKGSYEEYEWEVDAFEPVPAVGETVTITTPEEQESGDGSELFVVRKRVWTYHDETGELMELFLSLEPFK